MSDSGDFCDPEVLVSAERAEEARFLAVLEAIEAAQEVAAANDFVNLAASLSALALMFNTGFDAQAWKALAHVSKPIREALVAGWEPPGEESE